MNGVSVMRKVMRITAVMMAVCMIFLSGCIFDKTKIDKVYASGNLTENVTGIVTDPDYKPGEEYNEAMADISIKNISNSHACILAWWLHA